MSGEVRVLPIRRIEEVTLTIEMRSFTSGFFSADIDGAERVANARAIERLIAPILREHEAFGPVLREVSTMRCPLCGYEWEVDPEDGLPSCCTAAQDSWREVDQ